VPSQCHQRAFPGNLVTRLSNFRLALSVRNKENMLICHRMANRPEPEPIMSREALAEFSRRLSMLSEPGVEAVYQTAYKDCAFDGRRLPSSAAIQQLVAAWKVLRRFRRKRL
jgi:hypothetical protein